jgi:hypothetical protein
MTTQGDQKYCVCGTNHDYNGKKLAPMKQKVTTKGKKSIASAYQIMTTMGTSTHGINHNYKRKKVASMEHIAGVTKFSVHGTNHDFVGNKKCYHP